MPDSDPGQLPTQTTRIYQRGTTAALAGLIVQLVLAVGVFLLAIYAKSWAIQAVAFHMILGLPIWLVLVLIYQQHGQERRESLETEQLAASDQQAAQLFEEAGQNLALAKARLEKLYRYGLPIASLIVGLLLTVVGAWMLWRANGQVDFNEATQANDYRNLAELALSPTASIEALLAITVCISLVAFLVARSVAGLTQVREWTLLRGGSAFLIGNVVTVLSLVVACILTLVGTTHAFTALAFILPGFILLLGLEILLAFLLGLYRPRKANEIPRPAFDSRLLGFLTRPESLGKIVTETLRYQFGIDFSGNWLYQLLGRATPPLLLFAIVLLIGISSLVTVPAGQQAVVTTFGSNPRYLEPGTHFKKPWPLDRVRLYDVYRSRELRVGTREGDLNLNEPSLWTDAQAPGQQRYLVTAPTQVQVSALIEGDTGEGSEAALGEYTSVTAVVFWRIKTNPEEGLQPYLNNTRLPINVLRTQAQRALSRYAAGRTIDQLISENRDVAGEALRSMIQTVISSEPYNLGIEVQEVSLVQVAPPPDPVATKFQDQAAALQERNTEIEKARGEEAKILAEVAGSKAKALEIETALRELETRREAVLAQRGDASTEQALAEQEERVEALIAGATGKASRLIAEARAKRTRLVLEAQSRARKFPIQVLAFETAPDYYRQRLYYQTLAEGLKQGRKIIQAVETNLPPTLRLELLDKSSLRAITDVE